MDAPKKIHFDLSLMGEADKRNLCSAFLKDILLFYDDPANVERFEKWMQERQQNKVYPKSRTN